MAKPFWQAGLGLAGLTPVGDRSRQSEGHPPIALSLRDGSARAAPLSHTGVLLREGAIVSSKPS
jgi:hypothetical protein